MRLLASWIFISGLCWSLSSPSQETGIKRSELPPPVERTVAGLTRNATVRGFSQEIGHGKTFYEAEMIVGGHHKDYLIDAQGNVVEVEEDVRLDSVPVAVQDALQAMTREGSVQAVESITRNGKLVAYEARVVNKGKRSEVMVSPEGEPLNHEP